MKANLVLLAVVVMLGGCNGHGSYNQILGQKVKSSLGADFKDYQVISYPTNNFGTGTLYRASDNLQLCDMWNCLGVQDKDIPQDFSQWRRLDGKVGVGEDGAIISLDEKESQGYVVSALLPKIASVLNMGASLDDKSTVKTELALGRAYPRFLRVDPWLNYMTGLKPDERKTVVTAFRDGNLSVVIGDVVLDSMRAKITVDKATAAKIDAALKAPVGVSKILNDGAKLEIKATKETEGVYQFDVTRPVIVMRLAKTQPGGGVLAKEDEKFKTWGAATPPDNSK